MHNDKPGLPPDDIPAFTIGAEQYGIDLSTVLEIRDVTSFKRNRSGILNGVVSTRGVSMPVIDMRIRFRLGMPAYDQSTAMVILRIEGKVMGIVADDIADVIKVRPEQLSPAPKLGGMSGECIVSVGMLNQPRIHLIAIEKFNPVRAFAFEHRNQ